MTLTADQERVRSLLKDTVTLLCKNGLDFKAEFSIDAVIGVTLDKSSLFYISIAETVKSDVAQGQKTSPSPTPAPGERTDSGERQRKRRLHFDRHKTEPESDEDSPQASKRRQPPAAPQPDLKSEGIKVEVGELDEDVGGDAGLLDLDEDDDQEVFIVKEEPHEDWSRSDEYLGHVTSLQDDPSNMPPPPHDSASTSYTYTAGPGNPPPPDADPLQDPGIPWQPLHGDTGHTQHQTPSRQRASTSSGTGGEQSCHLCYKAFASTSSLRRHMAAHFGKHPYQCDFCERGFTSLDNLQGHVGRAHTGERQFSCDLCDLKFFSKGTLTSHKTRVHGVHAVS